SAGHLRGDAVAGLRGGQAGLRRQAGPLATQGAITEAKVTQLPDEQRVEVRAVTEVPDRRARPAAEPPGPEAELDGGDQRPPLLLPETSDRCFDEGALFRQFGTLEQGLGDQ